MKATIILASFILIFSYSNAQTESLLLPELEASTLIDSWHKAAANADTLLYFGLMDDSSVFIGTDPNERWTLEQFKGYVMPFFRAGRGWDFTATERNFRYLDDGAIILWDEKLDTWMGPCLSTGILELKGNEWKIIHYHLAFTVPNEDIGKVLELLKSESLNH